MTLSSVLLLELEKRPDPSVQQKPDVLRVTFLHQGEEQTS